MIDNMVQLLHIPGRCFVWLGSKPRLMQVVNFAARTTETEGSSPSFISPSLAVSLRGGWLTLSSLSGDDRFDDMARGVLVRRWVRDYNVTSSAAEPTERDSDGGPLVTLAAQE